MMAPHLLAVLWALLLSSCAVEPVTINKDYGPLYINADLFKKGILNIRLPEKRPQKMAIQSPSGEWFVLQDPTARIAIMPQASFATNDKLEFELRLIRGITSRNGVASKEHVFEEPGVYRIYFADNLDAQSDSTFSMEETVNYP